MNIAILILSHQIRTTIDKKIKNKQQKLKRVQIKSFKN